MLEKILKLRFHFLEQLFIASVLWKLEVAQLINEGFDKLSRLGTKKVWVKYCVALERLFSVKTASHMVPNISCHSSRGPYLNCF
jgi:hypothetical protein